MPEQEQQWRVEKHRIPELAFECWYVKAGQRIVADLLNEEDARAIVADHAKALRVSELEKALKHATWMNRWQFDEHRTGGRGDLKDEAFCRCDWCKTYRDTRDEDRAPLRESLNTEGGS